MKRDLPPPIDVRALLGTLTRHGVRFVVIGGVAGIMHGSATLTSDVDIVYDRDRENIRRLAAALAELRARRRNLPEGTEAPVDERAVLNGLNFLLRTPIGDLDCLGETPAERLTYRDLAPNAVRMAVADDVAVEVTSLDDLIRMKRATGRERDRIEVERLAALRDEHELREAAPPYVRPRRGRPPTAAPSPAGRRGTARPARRGPSRTRAR
jgi:hypothetical protein